MNDPRSTSPRGRMHPREAFHYDFDAISAKLRLVAVSDGKGDVLRLERIALAAALGGASAIIIREPQMPVREKVDLARRLVATLRPHGVLVLMNDRIDVALAAGADGAQLGFRSLPLDVARRMVAPEFLLGFSAHEGDPLDRIAEGGADFALLGPIFDTPSKRGTKDPIGPEKLFAIATSTSLPIVGIGGVEVNNIGLLRSPELAGVAVVRAIFEAPDPTGAARELRAALG